MQLIRVETFHYPDGPRYFYPAVVVDQQPDRLMLFSPYNSPVWNGRNGEVWRSPDHALEILYSDRDYNVVMFWNGDWSFSAYYVNIALPAQWDDQKASYIDLDLDLLLVTEQSRRAGRRHPQPGLYELDRDEFDERRVLFNYPPEIVARAEAAVLDVKAQIEARRFPFDDSLMNFRPDSDPLIQALADLPDDLTKWYD